MSGTDDNKTQEQLDAEAAEAEKNKQNQEVDPPNGDDDFKDPVKAKAEIEKLRKEAASNRVKAKELQKKLEEKAEREKAVKKSLGIETDEESPEDKIKSQNARIEELEADRKMREVEDDLGITKDGRDYFRFLFNKEADKLKDDEEMSEETLQRLVKEVEAKTGKPGAGKVNGTGVGGGKNPDPAGTGNDPLTLADFNAMSVAEQSKLYLDNRAEYDRLKALSQKKKVV